MTVINEARETKRQMHFNYKMYMRFKGYELGYRRRKIFDIRMIVDYSDLFAENCKNALKSGTGRLSYE